MEQAKGKPAYVDKLALEAALQEERDDNFDDDDTPYKEERKDDSDTDDTPFPEDLEDTFEKECRHHRKPRWLPLAQLLLPLLGSCYRRRHPSSCSSSCSSRRSRRRRKHHHVPL